MGPESCSENFEWGVGSGRVLTLGVLTVRVAQYTTRHSPYYIIKLQVKSFYFSSFMHSTWCPCDTWIQPSWPNHLPTARNVPSNQIALYYSRAMWVLYELHLYYILGNHVRFCDGIYGKPLWLSFSVSNKEECLFLHWKVRLIVEHYSEAGFVTSW